MALPEDIFRSQDLQCLDNLDEAHVTAIKQKEVLAPKLHLKARTCQNFNKKLNGSSVRKKEITVVQPDEQHEVLSLTDKISQNWAMKN